MSSAETGWSLRGRLLGRTLVALFALWILSSSLVIWAARIEVTEDLDDSLHRTADLLLGFAEHEYQENEVEDLAGLMKSDELPRSGLLYQIWAGDQLLLRSKDAPLKPLSRATEGYEDLDYGGESWRLYTAWNDTHNLRVQIAEPQWHRREIAGDLSLVLLIPLLLALPGTALLVWLAVTRGLAPAHRAASVIAARAPEDFSPLPDQHLPRELQPLVDSFNGLLQRLSRALENERRFTEDVAHELRTPLAAIRLQAQIAGRAEGGAAAQTALERLLSGVDRATRVVDQLMTLARLDPRHTGDLETEDFSLARIAEETLHELMESARQRGLRLELQVGGDDSVHTSPQAVYIVLRNLIDNALRHTPAGGSVQVRASAEAGELRLEVEDQGPGIPVEQRHRVLERFVHLQAGSSGLGLFIVRRAATALGGGITIGDREPPPGARIRVHWPLRPR